MFSAVGRLVGAEALETVVIAGPGVARLKLVDKELVTLMVNISLSSKSPFTLLSVIMSLGLNVWLSMSSTVRIGMRGCNSILIFSVSFAVKFKGKEVEESSAVQLMVPFIMILTEPSGCSVEVVSGRSSVVEVSKLDRMSFSVVLATVEGGSEAKMVVTLS